MAPQTNPSLTHYLMVARAYPELSREQEHVLALRWLNEQDEAAREQVVRAHLRDVVTIAFKYRRYGLPLSELIAEATSDSFMLCGSSIPVGALASSHTLRTGFAPAFSTT